MAQSLSKIYVHVIFSTKHRWACLDAGIREELFPYMATVLNNLDCPAIQVGGASDHPHALCVMSKNIEAKKLIEEMKKPTSKWLKAKGALYGKFSWQNGYGAFSVSQSQVQRVRSYILGQEEHHKRQTFQDEYRAFLKKYEIPYDERYVWD